MPIATEKSAYLAGMRDGWPFIFVAAPFSMLFGVVAIEAGLTLGQAMGFSVVVIAGAAQFAAVQLMMDGAGIALVLMAALDTGGHCDGVVFRIEAALVDQETRFMWNREMFAGSYNPVFHTIETPQGPVEALLFVMNPTSDRYVPDLPQSKAAERIATAEGNLGTNFAYLDSLIRHLDELGLERAPGL